MNKQKRYIAIQEIISKHQIRGQDELLNKLEKKGFSLTQATLSRDLKFLKVARISDNKEGYIYVLPQNLTKINITTDEPMHVENIKSIEFSNNMGVMKTSTGFANGIALKIDNMELYEILGTIAGDDTILIIPREGITRREILNALMARIPELTKIINH